MYLIDSERVLNVHAAGLSVLEVCLVVSMKRLEEKELEMYTFEMVRAPFSFSGSSQSHLAI